jgi:hypothetical protein
VLAAPFSGGSVLQRGAGAAARRGGARHRMVQARMGLTQAGLLSKSLHATPGTMKVQYQDAEHAVLSRGDGQEDILLLLT